MNFMIWVKMIFKNFIGFKNNESCERESTLPPTAPWAFGWENDLNSHLKSNKRY